ncbi:DUF5666 domain-containing protein [Nocardia transvalensis]|uniref:DUF5666 domain-containing protein n=1 Tax=Nocardia transvalensis TaxID=37333 RepID=UPI001894716F|nr:DUF5666 domain-containing protein [Nocardia transvalensis]MBF6329046.1 hypothetical protein [Nocardia transvalensis]
MTNPSDPWAQRPDSPDAPTEQVGVPGRPGEPRLHTTEYSEAYGYGATATEPYQYFDQPPGPNATRVLPPYENQWGAYESQAYDTQWDTSAAPPPGGPGGPYGPTGLPPQPPRRNRTGLWIALTLGIFVLVVLGGVAVGMLMSGNDSSSSTASATTTRSAPTAIPVIPPRSTGGPQSSLPPLPGLGDIDGIGATMGTIKTNDGATLTIDSLLGSTVTVHTDDKTQVIASGASKVADLHPGDMVVVQGDKGSDGSIKAEIIISTMLTGPR